MTDTDTRVKQEFIDSEEYCTEYTTDHGLPEGRAKEGLFAWAFLCPRCGATNPLAGDPLDFRSKPFSCQACSWVSLLEETSLEEFAREEGLDD